MSGSISFQGLVSGIDTTELIDTIIAYERQPAVLMEESQTLKTKEISAYKALEAKLLALQTSMVSLQSAKSFSQASISVSDEDYLTATASGTVSSGTYTLNILALAQNHQIASQGFDAATETIMGTGTIILALGNNSSTTITIDEGQNSLNGIKNAINEADAGITASIINDGSASNPYRLILTGDETGRDNKITISSSLAGGLDLDYSGVSFDNPEEISFSAQTTSAVSLGASAAYTGTTNKTYTFTVRESGTHTLGSGNVIIDYTDGTEAGTGSIVVDQADTEIIGPDGLRLTFSDGDLVGGDSFQVTAFAPLIQQASDAQISLGTDEDGASAITVRSDSNHFEDVIPGLELDISKVTTASSGPITITTGLDTSQIKSNIQTFIDAYNDTMD